MSREPLCRLEAVSKRYRPQFRPRVSAVTNLSFELFPGEVLGLLGPPGAGKSTVLRLLSAKTKPSSGLIWRSDEGARPLVLLDEQPPTTLRPTGTAVIATASTALAHQLCDRVLLLDQGRSPGWLPAEQLQPWVKQSWYRIRLQGYLTERMLHGLEELSCRQTPEGQTVLTGPLPDAAALYGLLRRVERFNLPLLEVAAIDPTLALIQHYTTASLAPEPG